MTWRCGGAILVLLVTLAACGPREEILPGKRLAIRAPLGDTSAGTAEATGQAAGDVARPIALPPQVNHAAWPQTNGGPTHRIVHPALGRTLERVWSADIGTGDSRKYRITADPVVAGGRVFTLDSQSGVAAHSTAGEALWTRRLVPAADREGEASGGGLAYGAGRLFVTTGFGAVVALDPATGAELWTQDLDGPDIGPPAVRDGIVYAVSRDNRAVAIDAGTGRLRWQLPGAPSPSGRLATAAPAVTAERAILPFASGELAGALRKSGVRIWSAPLAGKRPGKVYATITDVTGAPVVDGEVTYAANPSGRLVALSTAGGERRWTAKEGALSPVWPVGGSVFLVSDQNELVRLDAATGARIWGTQLPYYEDPRARRRKAVYAQYGPVLAGGRLLVASGEGLLRAFDPETGALVARTALPGAATSSPVVAGRTLYVVTGDGRLHAFR